MPGRSRHDRLSNVWVVVTLGSIAVQSPTAPAKNLRAFIRKRLFRSPIDLLITCVGLLVSAYVLFTLVNWAFIESVWSKESAQLCKEAEGACWAVIHARYRLIFFGLYPYDEHWRSALACV